MNKPIRQLWILAIAASSAQLCAQSLPPATLPGRIEQDSKKEPQPASRKEVIQVDRARFAEQVPAGAAGTRLVLSAVTLRGNTVIPTAELAPLWASSIGKEVSLSEVFTIAARISAHYRARGYVLSQAIVPQQDLRPEGASVRIEVLEGYVDKLSLIGIDDRRLRDYFVPVLAEKPLRLATLERSLLLVNELAGVNAQANLKAGSVPNASDLAVVVAKVPAQFSLSAHNRSAPAQGRVRVEAGAELLDTFGMFDRHTFRLISSGDNRLNLLSYGFEAPLGSDGLKLQLSASSSRSKPTTALGNIDTNSDNLSIGVNYPLLRSRQINFGLRAALAGYNNSSDSSATTATTEDRIRAVRVGAAADYADFAGGISMLDLEVSKGLSALGATRASDNYLPNPAFSKFSLYAARLQNLRGEWSILLAVTAQHSSDPLPTAEQLGLGGDTFLRAYDPSEVIGENGAAAKAELRYNVAFARVQSTVYTYFDAGSVRRKQAVGPDLKNTLAAAGVGVRFSGPARLKGYLEIAKPLRGVVASRNNKDARVFAGIGIDF